MDEFQSEKEQIEEIKQWWQKNGSFIVTGMILGVGVLGGWKYWQNYKLQRAAAASAHYEQLVQAITDRDRNGATELADKLSADYAATPYSSQAALAMAKFYVQADEPELAAGQLRAVLDRARDEYLKLVARHRLARVLLSQDRAGEALTVLEVANPGSFAARFHEVRGDAYAALGRPDDARSEYQLALDAAEPGLLDRQMVEMKLSDLGPAPGQVPTDTAAEAAPDAAPEIEPGA